MVVWWIVNALALLFVAPLVIFLANRVIRAGEEIDAYADDILEHGVLLAKALSGGAEGVVHMNPDPGNGEH